MNRGRVHAKAAIRYNSAGQIPRLRAQVECDPEPRSFIAGFHAYWPVSGTATCQDYIGRTTVASSLEHENSHGNELRYRRQGAWEGLEGLDEA